MKIDIVTKKFLSALESFSLCGGVLVALSGGADSVCLLNLFIKAKESGLFPYKIAAAHLNHNLRGDESDSDEAFCKEICKKYQIELFVGSASVASLAEKSKKGIEEAARSARYAFLEETAKKADGISYIATAHNQGDLCETVILNLARGSGLDGMCSIPERRGNIIRPILKVSKSEIIKYNEKNSLPFVTDSTNLLCDYSRNRIRHNILPELEKLYSGYASNIERGISLMKQDADYLAAEASKLYADVVSEGVLHTKKAQNFHLSMLSRIVRMLYNYYGFKDLTEAHTDAICDAIKSDNKNFTLSLHKCYCICERGELRFCQSLDKQAEFSLPISIGETVYLPCGIAVSLSSEKTEGAYPLRADALPKKMIVRSRKDGDKITFFKTTHKIKRIISDKKLSASEKAKLFFLCDGKEIIYSNIPVCADKAFAHKGDNIVYITVKEI